MQKMKTILFATCIFHAFPSIAQTSVRLFEIPEGKTRTLTVHERNIHIEQLLLGNNCTIIVPPEMDGWTAVVNEAQIGTGVKILASGVPGIDGGAGFPGAKGAKGGTGPTGGSIGGRGD